MNRISAALTQADRDAIAQAIQTIEAHLPFLVDLIAEERSSLAAMGNKTRTFVEKAYELAATQPDFLPRSFDVEEMRKSLELIQDLNRILMSLTQLQNLIDDTCLLARSDAYTAALTVYNNGKANGSKTKGMEPILQELRQALRSTSKPKPTEEKEAGSIAS
jgi:hypothetical protein